MKDYYEELWRALPQALDPPDLELRRGFLLGHVRPGDRALDVGCGDGRFTAELAAAGASVVGVDVAEAALERARTAHPGLEFQLVGIDADLPFADNSFDLVWASEVIEHIGDTARFLSELRRVLLPGGRLLITTPAHGRVRLLVGGIERFSPPLGDHLHLYSKASLRRVLEEFGFAEVRVRAAVGLPPLRRALLAQAVR
jgi:ubiquinone/menaquinone biosynthesis C-methylase UbiE